MDETIVQRAQRGDREAYEELARGVAQRLYPIAYRILRDRDLADDALQRTLVAIWRDLPKLREPDRFEAWSYRILARFCADEQRQRRTLVGAVSELHFGTTQEDAAGQLADRDALERAFARLSPEHRAVVVMTYYSGLRGTEVADALGIPAGTVASRLHHALRSLRASIAADSRTVSVEVPS